MVTYFQEKKTIKDSVVDFTSSFFFFLSFNKDLLFTYYEVSTVLVTKDAKQFRTKLSEKKNIQIDNYKAI